MYVVTAKFTVKEEPVRGFVDPIVRNARDSLESEPGCRQFDVCIDTGDPRAINLYEVYIDRTAFDAHLATEHCRQFDRDAAPWADTKVVRLLQRIDD